MKKKLSLVVGSALAWAPLAFAQITTVGSTSQNCNLTTLGGFLCKIGSLLNSVVPVLIALGVVYFVYGVITYVVADDEEAKSAGRNRMIFGVIGLVVIVGVWGLVNVVRNTFGLNNSTQIQLPTIPVVNQ